MVDHVKNWVSSAQGAEYTFFEAVYQALQSFQNGDGNSLGKVMCIANGKTCKRIKRKELERLHYATPLKRILDRALENVTYKFKADADFGVVFDRGQNGGVNQQALNDLTLFFGKTVKHDKFREKFPAKAKTNTNPANVVAARRILNLRKALLALDGIDVGTVNALMSAKSIDLEVLIETSGKVTSAAPVVTVKSDVTPVATAPAATRNDDHATH